MMAPQESSRPSPWWRRSLPLAGLALLLAAPALPAQEVGKAASSLEIVPADAYFYSAMLRNREQLEAVLHSKAWAKLTDLPFVKMAWQFVEAGWNQPFGPQAKIKEWYDDKENQQLIRLLGEMFSDEVFVYGGRHSADFFALLGELQTANQFAPLQALLQGKNAPQGPFGQARILMQALAANADLIHAPDLVVGFRLKDTKRAHTQLKRLDRLVKDLTQQNPQFEGRWHKAKIGGGEFYTLKLDGRMVPWDMVPWQLIEENQGEFDNVKKKLRELKLAVSVGLRGPYLIAALTETPGQLKALGGPGKRLAAREELRPLAPFAERPVTGISFASKEWQALTGGAKKDLQAGVERILDLLKEADLSAEQKAKIHKDLKALAHDMKKYIPEPAPSLSFSFLNGRGSESYHYNWTKSERYGAAQPLTILKHVGGTPLLVFAERTPPYDPEEYKLLVKWIKIGWSYADEFGVPKLPEDVREKYQTFMKGARPLLSRLDRATGEMLLPSLTGQTALAVDGRLISKQWFAAMPPAAKPLPMLEPALVLGVKDAELLRKAASEYRAIFNQLVTLAGQPDLKLAAPHERQLKADTLYFYPLPKDLGADKQLSPTAGLSEHWAVLTVNHAHAIRLLHPTPLKTDSKLLADGKGIHAAVYFSWEGLVAAAAPWLDYALQMAPANAGQDVPGQVHTVLDVLKVFRSYTSVTYTEGGAQVTHGECIFRDLE
jgi:hypothetical protein